MTIARLNVVLGVQVADFHRQMEDVARRTERVGRRIARAGLEISQAISLPLIAAGVGAFKAALDESHRSFGPLFTAWEQLKARVRDVGIAVGQQLTPMFLQLIGVARSVVTFVLSIVDAFSRLPSGVQKAITTTLLFLAALGPTVLVVGKLIKVLGAIPSLFAAVTSPIGLAVVAVAAFAAAGLYVITHWEQVKLRMVLVWTAIKEAVFSAVDGVIGVMETLAGWTPILGDAIKNLRANFNAWADQSLAHSAERIQELEKGLRKGSAAVAQSGAVLQAVRDTIQGYNEAMRQLAVQTVAIGPRFNTFAAQAEALKRQLDEIIKAGPQAQAQFEAMVMPLDQLAQLWLRANDAAQVYAQGLDAVAQGYTTYAAALELANRVASGATSLQQAQAIIQAQAATVQDVMGALQDSIAAFGVSVADILSGTAHGFSGFASALEGIVGSVMEKIGKTLVMLGLTAIAYGILGKAIQSFAKNPIAAIAAGAALIVLGHALGKAAQNISAQGLNGGGGGAPAAAPASASASEPQPAANIVLELRGDAVVTSLFRDPRNQDAFARLIQDLTGKQVIVSPVTA